MSYQKFTATIRKSNGMFDNQLTVARKMIELDDGENAIVEKEIENKIVTLNAFIDKMEDLINELVIQLSSNREDDDDINALFKDMDDSTTIYVIGTIVAVSTLIVGLVLTNKKRKKEE